MSKKSVSEEYGPSWEDSVGRYLADHPEFFERRPDLLAPLRIPHTGHMGAISLIEKQVSVLRENNQALNRQLQGLVNIARENDLSGERLHRFTMALCDAATLEDALGTLQDSLRGSFHLEAVALVVDRGVGSDGSSLVVEDGHLLQQLVRRIRNGIVACDGHPDASLCGQLFGERGAAIRSLALLALGSRDRWGVLALGSDDSRRFHPDIGTVYLGRLGETVGTVLGRLRPESD